MNGANGRGGVRRGPSKRRGGGGDLRDSFEMVLVYVCMYISGEAIL